MELASEALRRTVTGHLLGLVRKELVRPDEPGLGGDDAFRFRHILIRDAAYEALPKAERAELHERFADWQEHTAADRMAEYEEVIAHHLEQAYSYRQQLGQTGEQLDKLRARAGAMLAEAGRQALERDDVRAASDLLERAVLVLPVESLTRIKALLVLGDAVAFGGSIQRAVTVLEEAQRLARQEGDEGLARRAEIRRLTWFMSLSGEILSYEPAAREAIQFFEASGDRAGEAEARGLLTVVLVSVGRSAEALGEAEQEAEAAHAIGNTVRERRALNGVVEGAAYGPMPVPEAIGLLEHARSRVAGRSRAGALLDVTGALIYAAKGDSATARASYAAGREMLEELGDELYANASAQIGARIELRAGNPVAAELLLRPADAALAGIGETYSRSTVVALLAEALARQAKTVEAGQHATNARDLSQPDDYASQALWRMALALAHALKGDADSAERLSREAVAVTQETDDLDMRGDALLRLAEVLALQQRPVEAGSSARQAIEEYDRKGNVAALARAQELLEQFQRAASP